MASGFYLFFPVSDVNASADHKNQPTGKHSLDHTHSNAGTRRPSWAPWWLPFVGHALVLKLRFGNDLVAFLQDAQKRCGPVFVGQRADCGGG